MSQKGRFLPVGQRAEVNALILGRAFRGEFRRTEDRCETPENMICDPNRVSPNRGFVHICTIATSRWSAGAARSIIITILMALICSSMCNRRPCARITVANDGELMLSPSHGENRGSIPLGSANKIKTLG
jgi:hypothetical protein